MKPTERPQYVSQINAFHRFTEGNYLPLDTFRIMAMLGVHSQNAALRARDALVDAGLLLYKKGGKGCPNQYRLLFFPCDHTAENGSTNENANGSTSGCPSEKKADDIIRQEKDKRKTREDSLLSAGADGVCMNRTKKRPSGTQGTGRPEAECYMRVSACLTAGGTF